MVTLSILIPTFNRADKLLRLLKTIESEITSSDIMERIQLLVSDNASTDDTPKIILEFSSTQLKFNSFRQTENIGFDGNTQFLYDQAQTDYVWFLGDDDIPLPGSISTIFQTLQDKNPDVLLFSFTQPPGSTVRQFDFPESIHLVTDPVVAIEHVLRYTKLSIFVMRKVKFDNYQLQVLNKYLGSGWYYISLAFSVLEASHNILLAVISEPLATCDEGYLAVSYTPFPFLHMDKIAQHSFVMKHQSNLPEFCTRDGYCDAIQFAFAAKTGSIFPEYPEEYDKFIRALECKKAILLRHPRSLLQFIALKLHITGLWPKIKPIIQLIKRIAKLFRKK